MFNHYTITAVTNNRAKLIISKTETDLKLIKESVVQHYLALGHQVIVSTENDSGTMEPRTYYPEQAATTLEELSEKLARTHLGHTLVEKRSDSADFFETSVWSAKAVIEAAYVAGKVAK